MPRIAGSIGAQTAAKISHTALGLFAARGYAAVSMREIADQVGVQAAALYNHFPTKQHILFSLLEGHMKALIAAWVEESRILSTPLEALEGFIRFHIRYHLARREQVFIAYMELRNLDADNFRRIEELRRIYEGYLRKILSVGQADKTFELSDVPVTAMAIIAMLTGTGTWHRADGRLGVDEIEEIYLDMVLRCVGAKQ